METEKSRWFTLITVKTAEEEKGTRGRQRLCLDGDCSKGLRLHSTAKLSETETELSVHYETSIS